MGNRTRRAFSVSVRPQTLRHGGGPVQGGMFLLRGFVVDVDDPQVPHLLTLHVIAHGGRLTVDRLEVQRRDGEPGLTTSEAKRLALDSYVSASLKALPTGLPLLTRAGEVDGRKALLPVTDGERTEGLQADETTRRTRTTPDLQRVYALWQEAGHLQEWSGKRTQYVAHRMGWNSRQYAQKRVSEARQAAADGRLPAAPTKGKP